MAGPAVFFVPLAIAGGKVFFKFATKKAAEVFKKRFAKAGSVTTRTPPKNATVTTTGSNKGKSIIKDLTQPVTKPSIRARNPNTTTLPKAPKSSGGGKAAGAAATAAGVAAGSTATGKDADKPKKSKPSKTSDQARDEARVAANQRRLAAKSASQGGGSVLSKKKKTKTSDQARSEARVADNQRRLKAKSDSQGGGSVLSNKKKKMTTPTPPPKRPKKSTKVTKPTPKPKMYTAINPRTGKPDFDAPKVTAAQRLKQEDKYKAKKKADDLVTSVAKASLKKKGKK